MRFFDTGILVSAATNQDERKRRIAIELIAHALEVNHDGVISVQVIVSEDFDEKRMYEGMAIVNPFR